MQNGTYKKILNAMPEGVFVFDDKLRVKFTNAAFRRSVSDEVKSVGTLADVVGCREQNGCGKNERQIVLQGGSSAFCAFKKSIGQNTSLRTP